MISLTTRRCTIPVDLLIASLVCLQRLQAVASNAYVNAAMLAAVYNPVIKVNGLWKILELYHFDGEDCKVRSEAVSGLILSGWALGHARRKRQDAY